MFSNQLCSRSLARLFIDDNVMMTFPWIMKTDLLFLCRAYAVKRSHNKRRVFITLWMEELFILFPRQFQTTKRSCLLFSLHLPLLFPPQAESNAVFTINLFSESENARDDVPSFSKNIEAAKQTMFKWLGSLDRTVQRKSDYCSLNVSRDRQSP